MGRLVACFPKEENLDTYGPPTASRAISMLNLPQPKLAQVLLDEAVITPLAPVVPGAVTKWRVSFALDPEDLARQPLADFLTEDYIAGMYERVLGGPRPIEYTIDRVSPYTMHQRLASTLKRGRCLLAGDTAHINTVCLSLSFSFPFPLRPFLV